MIYSADDLKCPCGLQKPADMHRHEHPCDRENDCFLADKLWRLDEASRRNPVIKRGKV